MSSSTPRNEKSMDVPIPPINISQNITLGNVIEEGYFSREKPNSANPDYVVFPNDLRQLRAFNKNHGMSLDLLDGYGTIPFIEYIPLKEPLGALKEYLSEKGLIDQLIKEPGSRIVVSTAGTIRELAVIPYSRYRREFCIERNLDDVLLIAKAPDDGQYQTERKKQEHFQGMRFELYMTKSPLKIDPNECFCAVYQAKLSGEKEFSLVYKCEIDCNDDELGGKYVELKTKTNEAFDKKTAKFDFLQWYLHLNFTTIVRIECGIRNNKLHGIDHFEKFNQLTLKEGYLNHKEHQPKERPQLKLFPEDETLENAGKGCLYFLYQLLCFIDETVRCGGKWTIEYSPPSTNDTPGIVKLIKSD